MVSGCRCRCRVGEWNEELRVDDTTQSMATWIDTCQTAFPVLYHASHMVKLAPVEDGHGEEM